MEAGTPEIANYPFVSGAIGRVENGFVIYEGSGTSANEKVLAHDAKNLPGIYGHGILPFSNTYDVITAPGMEGEKNKIPIRSSGGNYTAILPMPRSFKLCLWQLIRMLFPYIMMAGI